VPIADSSTIFSAAIKRSITIAGHPTSIRIESPFWQALLAEADTRGLPVSALVAQIDAARLMVERPPNLASAIRLWLFAHRNDAEAQQ
jgi:predicted DNA-binding ribbon-helix-helix protein